MEGAELMRRGTLRFPPGITIVFADEGRSQMLQDDFRQTPRVREHTYGVYYHVAFWAEGPHLVQGVRPEKMKRNFDALAARGDTHYAVINVANVREHVLGVAAAMEIMRQGAAWNERDFLDRWSPPELRGAYREFLASLVELRGDRLLQDGTCSVLAKRLLAAMERKRELPLREYLPANTDRPDALAAALLSSVGRLDGVLREYPSDRIPPATRAFYEVNLRVQASMLRHFYAYLRELLLAADDPVHLRAACDELSQLLQCRRAAARNQWADWYRGDKKENLSELLDRTRTLADQRLRAAASKGTP